MKVARPGKDQVEARINDILGIWLDGAQGWDIVEFVRGREKEEGSPWHVGDGQKPLSYGQVRRYVQRAEAKKSETVRDNRDQLFRRHLSQRRNLYAKAVSQGDIRSALACLDSEAKMLAAFGVFPEPEQDRTKKPALGSITLNVVEQLVVRHDPPALTIVPQEEKAEA